MAGKKPSTLSDILSAAYTDEGLSREDVLDDKGFWPTGNLGLDYSLGGGIARGRIAEFYGLSQSGKAQPLDSDVLTPSGFVHMGSLKVGEAVVDPEGQPSVVTGVFPQGEQDIYRLTFSDGSTCETTADHLWPFRFRVSRRAESGGRSSRLRGVHRPRQIFVEHKVVPLSQMMTSSRLTGSSWRPVLDADLRSDIDFAEGSLPVDPYLLGLLLGDGSLGDSIPRFTTKDPELLEAVRTKFVPAQYKISSAKTRLAVLQGLFDTDAEACSRGGAAVFGSASRQLRDDVVWLARSLGFRVTARERKIKGERVGGGPYFTSYSARVCSRTDPLFRLPRKAEVWARRSERERQGWVGGVRPRVLVSVEFSRRAEAQCISVSAPSHLYVTDDFIPTHNTTAAVQCAVQVQRAGYPIVYVDFEQALDKPYLRALGLNVDDAELFFPIPSSSLEQGMLVASEAIRTGQVGLAVFDSIPAMVPRKAIEENSESRTMAMERARLLGHELAKLNPILARTGTSAVFINHLRDVINTGWVPVGAPTETTPGGSGTKFYASQRVKFAVGAKFDSEITDPLTGKSIKRPHSFLTRATVTKNKLAPPQVTAELYLELGQGFNNVWSAISVLTAAGVVVKDSATYRFPEDLYHPNMSGDGPGGTLRGIGSVLALGHADPSWEVRLVEGAVKVLENFVLVERNVAMPEIEPVEEPAVQLVGLAPPDSDQHQPTVAMAEAVAATNSDGIVFVEEP